MATPEEDALEDLAYATPEGPSEQWDSADPGAVDPGDYADYGEYAGGDAADYSDYGDYGDSYQADAGEYGDFGGEDGMGAEEAEESVSQTIAGMLGAESEDEFLGRLVRGATNLVKKAAPIVGKIARAAGPILKVIPHPYAKAAAMAANVLGKLRAEGATIEDALEAVAELASRDTRALPIVAGLAARSMVEESAAQMSPAQRQHVARVVTRAATNLLARGGPPALRALPKIAASVMRTSMNNRTPPQARPQVLARTASRVAGDPNALRNLSAPSPRARQILASVNRMENGGRQENGADPFGSSGYGGYGGYGGGMGQFGNAGFGGYRSGMSQYRGRSSGGAQRIRVSGPATIFVKLDR